MSAVDPGDLQLTHEEAVLLRQVLAEPVVGFSTQGGSAQPLSPHFYLAPQFVVHCSASILITAVSVDVSAWHEVYPIAAHAWRPELLQPWAYKPAVGPVDRKAEDGLDLTTPLGRIVEISVFSIAEPPVGDVEYVTKLDTALLLAVDDWRLLIESMWHTDQYRMGFPLDLALTTDPSTIDRRLAQGTVRTLDGRSAS